MWASHPAGLLSLPSSLLRGVAPDPSAVVFLGPEQANELLLGLLYLSLTPSHLLCLLPCSHLRYLNAQISQVYLCVEQGILC